MDNRDYFPGFRPFRLKGSGAEIAGVTRGSGPPLLLLHGYPQTHLMWHRVAPVLAERFTVVAADLRGYGASSKPESDAGHTPYSKRAMAADMVAVMRGLGHDRFLVGAHDRGARVAHRMALDAPDAVAKLALLDVAPTREMYAGTTDAFARAYWHWFFLILPEPFPERMINADPEAFWLKKCGSGSAGLAIFPPEVQRRYIAAFTPDVIHASCEDYRAAATIDIVHDDADEDRRVNQPLLVLWGENGIIGRCFDPIALWRRRAKDVRGGPVPGGHYLAEEIPDRITAAFADFFHKR
jgi:haloacetate dehalogenase